MSSQPRISVAMATYNGARFIAEQLASIAHQTVLPDELVICDDGSLDGTGELVSNFAARAPFEVQWHANPERLGYVRNFRRAASLCGGDVIVFSDQDDIWAPGRISTVLDAFQDPSALLVYHNAMVVDEAGEPLHRLYDPEQEQAALALQPIAPWHHSYGLVQAFRSRLRRFDHLWDSSWNHIPEPMDILAHDQWYFFLAQVLGRVAFVDEELVGYRQHGSNTVGASWKLPSVGASLASRFEHYGRQDYRGSLAATARAEILERIVGEEPDEADRLKYIATNYRQLAAKHQRRYETYAGPTFARRLARLLAAVRNRDYAGWPWGFDLRSVPRDLWSGVLRHQVQEPGSSPFEM